MNSGLVRAESNTLPQPQNKQDILWTVADQTLRKHWSPGTQLMPLEMTCLPSVWLLVLISADEDECNQGSSPWWATGDIKPEAILHNLMVSTVQFLALKKEKAEKFLHVVSYRVVSEVSHELDRTEMLLWAFNGPGQRHFFATYSNGRENARHCQKPVPSFYCCELISSECILWPKPHWLESGFTEH